MKRILGAEVTGKQVGDRILTGGGHLAIGSNAWLEGISWYLLSALLGFNYFSQQKGSQHEEHQAGSFQNLQVMQHLRISG